MRRQDEQGLDQREGQRRDHDERDLLGELNFRTGQQHPGREHHDGGDDREDHRLGDHLRTDNSRRQSAFAAFHPVVNILPHHNGIVDHDADHKQEGEQRQHVQGDAHHRQQQESAAKGDENADRDPEGDGRTQEEEQDDQNQSATNQGGVQDRVHPALIELGIVPPQRQGHAIRQFQLLFVDILTHDAGHIDDVDIRRGQDDYQGHRFAIEGRGQVGIDEAVIDAGDVAQAQRTAISGLADDNVLELGLGVGELASGEIDVAKRGAGATRRRVERAGPHGTGDLVKRHVVALEVFLGEFDGNLLIQRRPQVDNRSAGQLSHLVTDLAGNLLQAAAIDIAVHGEADDLVLGAPLAHHRPEG